MELGFPLGMAWGMANWNGKKMVKKWQIPAIPAIFAVYRDLLFFLPFQNFGCFGCQTVCHSFAILDFEDESTPQGMPGRVFALCGRLVLGIPGSRATA